MRRGGAFSTGASAVLVALLTIGIPGPALQAAMVTTGTSGSLSIETDPAGATVYVDGMAKGSTPLNVSMITPGDHRVHVVKEGYLENSQVVNVPAGRTRAVQVRLTAGHAMTLSPSQVEEKSEKKEKENEGGKSKKWLWIGLGAVVVGGGVATYLITTKNDPPVAAGSVSPSGTGMAGLTTYTFDGSQSSDPNGDSLTYTWNFGDGRTGSGARTTHSYERSGTYAASLTVSDGKLSASAAVGSVTVMDNLTGFWSGTHSSFHNTHSFSITQSAASFTGTWSVSGGFSSGSISGEVSSSNNFICPCTVTFSGTAPCPLSMTFSGTLSADGTTLTGTGPVTFGACATIQGTFQGSWSLRR